MILKKYLSFLSMIRIQTEEIVACYNTHPGPHDTKQANGYDVTMQKHFCESQKAQVNLAEV